MASKKVGELLRMRCREGFIALATIKQLIYLQDVTLQNANAWADLRNTKVDEPNDGGEEGEAEDGLWDEFKSREQEEEQRVCCAFNMRLGLCTAFADSAFILSYAALWVHEGEGKA